MVMPSIPGAPLFALTLLYALLELSLYSIASKSLGCTLSLSFHIRLNDLDAFTCQIVPAITLFATLVHNGISSQWFCQWIQLAVICFPMALCLQVFFVEPLVRLIFRTIFKNQLNNN